MKTKFFERNFKQRLIARRKQIRMTRDYQLFLFFFFQAHFFVEIEPLMRKKKKKKQSKEFRFPLIQLKFETSDNVKIPSLSVFLIKNNKSPTDRGGGFRKTISVSRRLIYVNGIRDVRAEESSFPSGGLHYRPRPECNVFNP